MKIEPGKTVSIPLRAEQIAKAMGISPRTVRLWIERGDLTATQPVKKGTWLIEQADLDEFLRDRKKKKRQK